MVHAPAACCMVHIPATAWFQLLYGSYSSCCMVHIPTVVHLWFIFQLLYGSQSSCCMVHAPAACCMVHIPAAVWYIHITAAVGFIFQLLHGSSCCMVHIPAAVWFIFQLGHWFGCYYGLYFRCCIVYVYLYGFPANHSVLIPPSSKPFSSEFDLI
jgi:hypothetical protein